MVGAVRVDNRDARVSMNMVGSYITDEHLRQIDAFAEREQITRSMAIRVLLAMALMELEQ